MPRPLSTLAAAKLARRPDSRPTPVLTTWLPYAAAGAAGLITFAIALFGIQATRGTGERVDAGMPGTTVVASTLTPHGTPGVFLSPAPGLVAVGVPPSSDPLGSAVRAGDHVDVLATLGGSGQPVAPRIVVAAARVLSPSAGSNDPLVIEVGPDDALALAHLLGSNVPLTYGVLAASGTPSATQPAVDLAVVRSRLGLPASAPGTPTAGGSAATPTPLPAAVPTSSLAGLAGFLPGSVQPALMGTVQTALGSTGVAAAVLSGTLTPVAASMPAPAPAAPGGAPASAGGTYVVQPGDTLSSIADRLGVDYGALRWANRQRPDPDFLLPGTVIAIPTVRGEAYTVQPGDTWDDLARRFGVPADDIRQVNDLPADAGLRYGVTLFIPHMVAPANGAPPTPPR